MITKREYNVNVTFIPSKSLAIRNETETKNEFIFLINKVSVALILYGGLLEILTIKIELYWNNHWRLMYNQVYHIALHYQ